MFVIKPNANWNVILPLFIEYWNGSVQLDQIILSTIIVGEKFYVWPQFCVLFCHFGHLFNNLVYILIMARFMAQHGIMTHFGLRIC